MVEEVKVLVCGDRNWTDGDLIKEKLKEVFSYRPKSIKATVIHGNANGADKIAGYVAFAMGLEIETYPANWKQYGKSAGIIRNQQMIDEGKPDKVIAFHDDIAHSKGTKDMITRAQRHGIPVELVTH